MRDLDAMGNGAGKKGGGRSMMLLAFKVVSPALYAAEFEWRYKMNNSDVFWRGHCQVLRRQ